MYEQNIYQDIRSVHLSIKCNEIHAHTYNTNQTTSRGWERCVMLGSSMKLVSPKIH